MAYTVVKTVTDGMAWTGKDCNTYFRDNFAASVPDIFTTKGDLAAATGGDAAERVGAGANADMLFCDSASTCGLIWKGQTWPKVRAKGDNSNQNGNFNNTWTKSVVYDSETFDVTAAFASNGFTPVTPGFYVIGATAKLDLITTVEGSLMALAIYKNSAFYSILDAKFSQNGSSSVSYQLGGMDILLLDSDDKIEIYFYHNTGDTDIRNSANDSWVQFIAAKL
jgi:hypothetical protein